MSQRIVLKRILSSQTRRSLYPPYTSSASFSISTDNVTNNHQGHAQAQRRFKTFQSTRTLLNEESKIKDAAIPSDEDECPPWQNPLHHNDPNKEKIMLEDYGPGEEPEMVKLPPIDDGSGKILADPELYALADEIVAMNMLEVKELVDRISEHFGFEDDDEDFSGGMMGGGDDAAAEEEVVEKTAFDLKLTGFDAKSKIKVIKEVRAITGLGLKEAKEMVEGAPKTLKGDINMEEAEELKAKLEAVGATVEIA